MKTFKMISVVGIKYADGSEPLGAGSFAGALMINL